MNLFELFATLSLDTSNFDTGVNAAVSKTGEVKDAIDSIDTTTLQNDLEEITETDISTLENEIKHLEKESSFTQGVLEGVVDVGLELFEKAIEAMVEFGAESLDYVADSGTAVGNQLKQTRQDFALTTDALKMKVGTFLAPISMAFMDLADSILGVTADDKLGVLVSQIRNIKAQNLIAVKESLEGIFGLFDGYVATEAKDLLGVESMTAALQSQISYWQEYERLLTVAKNRGLSDEIIAMFADGSESSMDTLRAFEQASDEELLAFENTYEQLATTREQTAETISQAQMSVDDSVDQINEAIGRIAADMDSTEASAFVRKAGAEIVLALDEEYQNISARVNNINAVLATLGSPTVNINGRYARPAYTGSRLGGATHGDAVAYDPDASARAVGLDYVPYNEFPALLHEGEAVLTKSEANAWRKGGGEVYAGGMDPAAIASAMRAALSDVVLSMDGKTVGRMVSGEVSKQINRDAVARRYTK